MTLRKVEIIVAVAVIILSGFLYLHIRSFSPEGALFPKTLVTILAILSLLLIIWNLRRPEEGREDILKDLRLKPLLIGIIGTFFYFLLAPLVGFYITTFIFLTFLSWIFSSDGLRISSLLSSLLYGASFTMILYLAFNKFLQIATPQGFLF